MNIRKPKILLVSSLFFILLLSLVVNAETILIIGDSHTEGAFGTELERLLQESGHTVIKEAVGGTNIYHWIQGEYASHTFSNFQTLLDTHDPDISIIALGTNHLKQSIPTTRNRASTLVSVIPPTSKCIWIGPPQVREDPPTVSSEDSSIVYTNQHVDQVYTAIQAGTSGRCTVIDSRPLAPGDKATGGGIHFPSTAAKAWATGVFNELIRQNLVTGTAVSGATRSSGADATSSTSASSTCTPTEYPIHGEAGDPWVYGCGSAPGQGIACKESTTEKNTFTIPIPPDPRASQYQRLLQACSSGAISTTDPSNKCDVTQFPINNIPGDPYAYGCIDVTHARSCKKSEGGVFRASFEIPTGTSDQAYQQLTQRCVSGTSVGATGSGQATCTNPQQCREIDEVWQRIGILVRGSAEIWDVVTRSWKAFTTVYIPITSSTTGTTARPAGGENAYDEMIRQAALDPKVQVPAALLKAIIKHESGFDPWEISATGCVGLFQICTTSAKYPYITKMSGVQLRTGSNNELDNVPSCCTGADCSPYRAACGDENWCVAAGYRCDPLGNGPLEDDRFDPQKNIKSGALTVKGKMDAIPEARCGIECQVAAYNIGECVILKALGEEYLQWEDGDEVDDDGDVYERITPEMMDGCSERYQRMDLIKKENKIKNLGPYVQGIINSYNQYRLAGIS